MSGINTGTGLVSGLDYTSLINQLLQIEARPRTLAQRRIVDLQSDQAAFLDLRSRLTSVRTAAAAFRTQNIFNSAAVASSNESALTASASTGAALGAYSFIVDRVVGTQQVLSRGFADRNVSAVGATSITFESARARLDTDTPLAALNGGLGVQRGRIVVTDNGGRSSTIDLSRASTIGEVLERLNGDSTVRISARIEGGRIVVEDRSGTAGTLRIEDAAGGNTATSLGIAGTATNAPLTGSQVYYLGDATSIGSLNDGNGIRFNNASGTGSTADFTIKTRDGSTYAVDIGDIWASVDGELRRTASPVADIASLRARIESQTEGKATLEVSADGRRLSIVDSSTPTGSNNLEVVDISGAATDLRLVGSTAADRIDGGAVLAGLNSTLASNLNGGQGLAEGAFTITTRDGTVHNFTVSTDGSVSDILREIGTLTGGDVTAELSSSGVGVRLTDTTGGSGAFIIGGAGADALGLSTGGGGVNASTFSGKRLQHRYVSGSTLLSSLNDGRGVGTGVFTIIGPGGTGFDVDIGTDSRSIQDVISEINSRGAGVQARVNDRGDGILIEKAPGVTGATAIEIRDKTGTVAKSLNIAGRAANATDQNFIDGSFETQIDVLATDTLDDLVGKINAVKPDVVASIIRDGSGSSPYRLKFSATQSGVAGAFTVDADGADLGLSTISQGRNARLFFGSDDAANAVLLESGSNVFDNVVDGLTINAKSASADPITLTVSRDSAAIETAVNGFVTAFNDLVTRIDRATDFNQDTNAKGTLLGDSTANELRRALFDQLLRPARGVSGAYRYMHQVGIRVGDGGQITLDSNKLREALANDPEGVAELFAARVADDRDDFVDVGDGIRVNNTSATTYRSLGIAEQFVQLVDRYTDSVSGLMTRRTRALDTEIAAQNRRISDIDAKLTRRRDFLTRQFAGLEQTLASLQSQQSALGSLGLATR